LFSSRELQTILFQGLEKKSGVTAQIFAVEKEIAGKNPDIWNSKWWLSRIEFFRENNLQKQHGEKFIYFASSKMLPLKSDTSEIM